MRYGYLKPIHRKLIWSLVAAAVGVLSFFSVLDALMEKTVVSRLDRQGGAYFTETIGRSAYTFAVVRGLNGVISVIQGTDVAVSPAGMGVTLAVGEILDPVNDLVERFSWVMLVATTSLGIQIVLMEMGAWIGFKILLTLAMALLLLGIWVPKVLAVDVKRAGVKLVLISLVIRFCVPAVALVSDAVYERFLKEKYESAIRSLEQANEEIKKSEWGEGEAEAVPEDLTYLEQLRRMYESTKETINIRERIAFLKEEVSDYAEYTISLITIFIVQTVLLPIFFLWFFLRLVGFIYGVNLVPYRKSGR